MKDTPCDKNKLLNQILQFYQQEVDLLTNRKVETLGRLICQARKSKIEKLNKSIKDENRK